MTFFQVIIGLMIIVMGTRQRYKGNGEVMKHFKRMTVALEVLILVASVLQCVSSAFTNEPPTKWIESPTELSEMKLTLLSDKFNKLVHDLKQEIIKMANLTLTKNETLGY